jgi:tRNA A37 threonylcarbamoyladenosine dehydratase
MEPGPDFYERGRRRAALGSLPTLTGIFGLAIANEAIKFLSGQKKTLI